MNWQPLRAFWPLQSWVARHPWVLLSLATGFGLGALFRLPLVDYSVPETTAQIVASLVGVFGAVGGAMWMQNWTQSQRFDEQRRIIDRTVRSVMLDFEEAARFQPPPGTPPQQHYDACRVAMVNAASAADERLGWLKDLIHHQAITELRCLLAIREFGQHMIPLHGKLGYRDFPARPSETELREAMKAASADLKDVVMRLYGVMVR